MKFKKFANAIPVFLLFVLLSVWSVSAQATGGLSGTVKDQNGGLIQGANVVVKNLSTNLNRNVVTNEDGRWTIAILPVGTYSVAYEKEGFKKSLVASTEVEASVTRNLDVALEVGGTDLFVDVTADQPLIQSESAATVRQINGEMLVKSPTSVRSFTGLLGTEAGVSTELSPVGVNGNGNQSPSVNGTRTTSTSLFFNGVDATNITSNEGSLNDNISPAPETLQEVKLQTSLYDASTGRSGGGNFQLVTKSGGNNFNGSVYYYLQNKAFNTNEFFLEQSGNEKPKADRTELGFTLGGPIIKDKFFFFGGYQFTDAETGLVPTARTRTILPLAMTLLGSDRSKTAIASAFNQFNGCSGGNCLTANDISDVAFRIFNLQNPVTGGFYLPTPTNYRLVNAPNATCDSTTLVGCLRDQTGTGSYQFGGFPTITSRTLQRNNPLIEVISVQPSLFKQHQFTTRLDGQLSAKNTLSGTFFFSNFPGLDSFPDPNSLASPTVLERNDQNRTIAISDTHVFSSGLINEARFGYYWLNNSRALTPEFSTGDFTNDFVGVTNPATAFDNSIATTRLGHYIGRNNIANFSFGGPNDSFNRRKQVTYSFADTVNLIKGNHNIKFGGEFKQHRYQTNLPEEQATEFEKFDSFTQLLTGNAQEADTQYGLTDKQFSFRDLGFFITDDWKATQNLSINLGLRYELFMWPTEKNGRIGNFDLEPFLPCFTNAGTTALCDDPSSGFLVPNNVTETGLGIVDTAVAATQIAKSGHTLNGQDTNNFAPRIGFAYKISDKVVLRGGYGLFYDRPSAAFINTVFSNYPFLREVEITVPSSNVAIPTAFSGVPTNIPLNQWLPFRVIRGTGAGGSYQIRDNTPVFVDARGTPQNTPGQTCNPATGAGCIRGNIAETFEFRAIDRDLRTPFVHQWNVGVQYEIARDLMFEARYVGTKGRNLLVATALNQGYDLNDPNTPDHVFERFNQAYIAAGSPNGVLNAGATARERGTGRAFGFANPYAAGMAPGCSGGVLTIPTGSPIDLNLANPLTCSGSTIGGGTVINFEARVPILGFNVPEALLLQSKGYSDYHGGQFSLTKRMSRGLQFNVAYTFSKSIDVMSTDPGSTAGSGKPDVPNSGFIAQGDARNLDNNKGLSDFDRTHRFSTNFVWDIPTGGNASRWVSGWSVSGFFQAQSGTPFTVFASEPEIASASQYADLTRGSGGLYRLGFGRPNITCSADDALSNYSTDNLMVLDRGCFSSARGGFGNMGRNIFRGPSQNRFDVSFAKRTNVNDRMSIEVGFDIFNVFDRVNLQAPNSDLQDTVDFGLITNTVGGPRVGQFRAKFRF